MTAGSYGAPSVDDNTPQRVEVRRVDSPRRRQPQQAGPRRRAARFQFSSAGPVALLLGAVWIALTALFLLAMFVVGIVLLPLIWVGRQFQRRESSR